MACDVMYGVSSSIVLPLLTLNLSGAYCRFPELRLRGKGEERAGEEEGRRRKANPEAAIVDRLNIAQILITASTRVWHNAGEMLMWHMLNVFTGLPTIA